jgi:hypothetical protein
MLTKSDRRTLFYDPSEPDVTERHYHLTHPVRALSIPHILKNEGVRLVSVAHELSSEIATAILARKQDISNLKELKEVVLRVHSALQKLTAQCREQDRHRRLAKRAKL